MKFNGISLLKSRFNQPQTSSHQGLRLDNPHSDEGIPKMVRMIAVGGEYFTVSGDGYHPQGNIYRDRHIIDPWQFQGLEECLIAGILCNNAQLLNHGIDRQQQWRTMGNVYEGALIALAHKAGLERSLISESMPRLDCLNDLEQMGGLATLHDRLLPLPHHLQPHRVIYYKSMEMRILKYCQAHIDIHGNTIALDFEQIHEAIAKMQDCQLEVIFLTKKYVPIAHQRLSRSDLSSELVLLGCVGA